MKKVLSFSMIVFLSMALTGPVTRAQAQWAISPQVIVSVPTSDFANVRETGGGFGLKVVRQTAALDGGLGLRGDFGFLTFGKTTNLFFDPTFGTIPVETRNESFRFVFGPQYRFGGRTLKFFVGANGGAFFYRTTVNARLGVTGQNLGSNSLDSKWALGWNVGAGFQYDIGLGPWIDVGFAYQTVHNVPEALDDNTMNDPDKNVPDITAHEFTIKFGVVIFIGR